MCNAKAHTQDSVILLNSKILDYTALTELSFTPLHHNAVKPQTGHGWNLDQVSSLCFPAPLPKAVYRQATRDTSFSPLRTCPIFVFGANGPQLPHAHHRNHAASPVQCLENFSRGATSNIVAILRASANFTWHS